MGKKRAREADGLQGSSNAPPVDKMDEDDSSEAEVSSLFLDSGVLLCFLVCISLTPKKQDFNIVNVEFEWFNFDPEVDFHGVKTLIRQLLDVDSQLFDLSALSDLVIEQRTIGSTVKVDDKANDAYAFLTTLNLAQTADKKPVADLVQYLAQKAGSNPSLAPVADILASNSRVGLILSDRLINMPSEIVPPMYSMLIDEIEAAVEDKEPYDFTHYLIVSKTYNEVQSTLDQGERKRKKVKDEAALCYFHPEDEVFQKHAVAYGSYPFTKDDESTADSKRAFQEMGVKSSGSMILLEASKFSEAVKAVGDYFSPPA